jgi:EAL domain-containing protein (putative c-di-GMP-specific phosphodiesterase class I)
MKYLSSAVLGLTVLFVLLVAMLLYNQTTNYFSGIQTMQKNAVVEQLRQHAREHLPLFATQKFKDIAQTVVENTHLQSVRFVYNKLHFDNNVLFANASGIDESWRIIDVTTDIQAGEIDSPFYGEYEFVPQKGYDLQKPVAVKFQALKNGFIKDFTLLLHFEVDVGKNTSQEEVLHFEGFSVYYSFTEDEFGQSVQTLYGYFLVASGAIVTALILFFTYFYRTVLAGRLYMQIEDINRYLQNVLDKNFQNSQGLAFRRPQMQKLLQNITDLSKSFTQTVNELNVCKDILEKKEITDELTGLPNKKWFEKDLKHMFVTNKEGYIVYLKIDKLGEFAKKHGGEIVNSLIEDFAKTVENFFLTNREFEGRFYRFVGAEFAMILYASDVEKIKTILQNIIAQTKTLDDKYYFFDNQIYYGAAPFDKYGTVESILQGAKDEFNVAHTNKELYRILDLTQQLEKNKELEKSVKDIIERDDFALQYVYDTYDFSEPPRLIMQEITPMLIDMRTFDRFPVGVFISVAEKMDLASEFDKLLIKKALSHIQMGELEHQIAINLSVGSFTSMRFITWLNSILTYESNAKNLVFVITAYSAAGNFERYKRFVETVVEFDAKVMIKRFDLNDFSLEQLAMIKPHFIRIEREYCNDIKRDTSKQHKVKQVLLFAEENDIKVLGDGVKNDVDYAMIEKLGFYGTSR